MEFLFQAVNSKKNTHAHTDTHSSFLLHWFSNLILARCKVFYSVPVSSLKWRAHGIVLYNYADKCLSDFFGDVSLKK